MLNNLQVLLTLRGKLVALQFAGTGVQTLTATANGFTRAAGSFVTDGFVTGMEVVPAGFADNTPGIVQKVQPLILTLAKVRTAEPAAAGRSLTVGIPVLREWENMRMVPEDDRWYIEEDYLPGPSAQVTGGIGGELEHLPMYVLRLAGLASIGVTALYKIADAILAAFPPRDAMALPDGTVLRVRHDTAPYRGQVLPGEAGKAEIVITIPLWARTFNPI